MHRRTLLFWMVGVLGLGAILSASAQDSVLVNPFAEPARPAPPVGSPAPAKDSVPDYVKTMLPEASPKRGLPIYEDIPDINRDLQVPPTAGNWLILVISYPSKNGPEQARRMCLEIRAKNRVPAYVYSFGADDRKKEIDRVKKLVDQQAEFLKQNKLTVDQPLRVRFQQIDVHHAVLIGGYPDAESANRALATIRNWPQPDEKKVDLEVKYYQKENTKEPSKTVTEAYYINPFKRAFVVRNPVVKQESQEPAKVDVAMLRRLNSSEPYSLFHCKKAYTLAVKEFQTPFAMNDRKASVWDVFGATKGDRTDTTALDAHNLAELLQKLKLESFVLHAKYSSCVTVGSYDSPDDPALKAMQETLAARFSQPPYTQIQFFHRPVPMAVPK